MEWSLPASALYATTDITHENCKVECAETEPGYRGSVNDGVPPRLRYASVPPSTGIAMPVMNDAQPSRRSRQDEPIGRPDLESFLAQESKQELKNEHR